jgi:ligand-binding SRPBCC domain-containing protein
MPTIHLTTHINAPVDRVFDLSRSTSLHRALIRTYKMGELEGGSEGLMAWKDKISFSLKYLGRLRKLVTVIVAFDSPRSFRSQAVNGPFQSLEHTHHFKPTGNGTLLIDILEYKPGYGLAGKLADHWIVKPFLIKYLHAKNRLIKQYGESEKWKIVIPPKP